MEASQREAGGNAGADGVKVAERSRAGRTLPALLKGGVMSIVGKRPRRRLSDWNVAMRQRVEAAERERMAERLSAAHERQDEIDVAAGVVKIPLWITIAVIVVGLWVGWVGWGFMRSLIWG